MFLPGSERPAIDLGGAFEVAILRFHNLISFTSPGLFGMQSKHPVAVIVGFGFHFVLQDGAGKFIRIFVRVP